MDKNKFKDLIEAPANREKDFWTRITVSAAIGRTVTLTLQYPELAQEYLDSLPKAVNESEPISTNKDRIIN